VAMRNGRRMTASMQRAKDAPLWRERMTVL
jgi:hypothetical protein